MYDDRVRIPCCSIHPNQVNIYYQSDGRRNSLGERVFNTDNLKDNSHNSIISNTAEKKIKKAATYLISLSNEQKQFNNLTKKTIKFRIIFVTLTLSSKQVHSDNIIKSQLLHQFLVEVNKKYQVTRYVWRAEKQLNGNIHFHLLIDKFIPYNELTSVWNRIQNKLGYVDRYRESMINFYSNGFKPSTNKYDKRTIQQQKQAYLKSKKNDFMQPNSTDIHSLRLVTNIKAYITKYLSKNENKTEQTGRLWGCSSDLSKLEGARCDVDSSISADLERLRNSGEVFIIDDTYYSSFQISIEILIKYQCKTLLFELLTYLQNTFNFHLQQSLPF